MNISRVIVFTPNVDRLAGFYRSSFGLIDIGEPSDEWAELDGGGCSIAFHQIDEHGDTRDGWVKIVFGSKDVRGEKERLESLGLKMSEIVEFGEIELCDGIDPDGNRFQISSRGL